MMQVMGGRLTGACGVGRKGEGGEIAIRCGFHMKMLLGADE